jgi:hypothetical protein
MYYGGVAALVIQSNLSPTFYLRKRIVFFIQSLVIFSPLASVACGAIISMISLANGKGLCAKERRKVEYVLRKYPKAVSCRGWYDWDGAW